MNDTLRNLLIERRKLLGLTQYQLAKLMGTTQSNISELEAGLVADIQLSTLGALVRRAGMRPRHHHDPAPRTRDPAPRDRPLGSNPMSRPMTIPDNPGEHSTLADRLALGALVLPALIVVAGVHIHVQEALGALWLICLFIYRSNPQGS